MARRLSPAGRAVIAKAARQRWRMYRRYVRDGDWRRADRALGENRRARRRAS